MTDIYRKSNPRLDEVQGLPKSPSPIQSPSIVGYQSAPPPPSTGGKQSPGSSDMLMSNRNSTNHPNKHNNYKIVGAALGAGLIVLLVFGFIMWYLRKKKRIISVGTITYAELKAATGGFSEENYLGEGGYGYVYKGKLPDGSEIAVKSLSPGSTQGLKEFQSEVDTISRIHHKHLVRLVKYCSHGEQRMLVYEFIANKTLDYHLHSDKKTRALQWDERMQIALGSAKGIAYLHTGCTPHIIHRDIKAANVLLDDLFEAKVADFGMARLIPDSFTHLSTSPVGTFGYLDPEYATTGKLTEAADVFSYGVLLLEIISGKRPLDLPKQTGESFVAWAKPLLESGLKADGNFDDLVDPLLKGEYNNDQMKIVAICALASTSLYAKKRPDMDQIVRALEGNEPLEQLKMTMLTSDENSNTPMGHVLDIIEESDDNSSDDNNEETEHILDIIEEPDNSSNDNTDGDTDIDSNPLLR